MIVNSGFLVAAIFILSSMISIYFIIKKPYMIIMFRRKRFRIESYFLGAVIGVMLLLAMKLISSDNLIDSLRGSANLRPLGILLLFFAMVFISTFLDQTGFFEYCARLASRYANNSAKRLFFSIYITVSVLTIFTSNDIIILTFTPFVYYLAKNAKLNPLPYLIAEFFAANTWSMFLYIGNPTNIIVASAFRMRFEQYTPLMILPTIAAGLVNVLILYWLFRKDISGKLRSDGGRPSKAITDRSGAIIGLIVMVLCIIALSLAPSIGIEMWVIAGIFSLLLFIIILVKDQIGFRSGARSKLKITILRMPWSIVPFVLSLFIMVGALSVHGISSLAGNLFERLSGGNIMLLVIIYGLGSAFAANLLNNIPMTVAFVSIMSNSGANITAAGLATVIGSNLGANITPLGALAGILWMAILSHKDMRIRFSQFLKYGLLVTIPAIVAALLVLGLELTLIL